MMWLRILDQAPFRALTGGILYTLLTLSLEQIARLAERSARSRNRGDRRARHMRLLGGAAQLLTSAGAIGFVFALLLEGTFAANDVGIADIDWPVHGPWMAVLIPGAMVLIVLFWGPYFSRAHNEQMERGPQMAGSRVLPNGDEPASLLNALRDEASLAIFRAASIPLLGPYYGVWFGLAWALGLRSFAQRRPPTRRSADRRGFYYLGSALDWLSATLFVATGSLWACLLGRLACQGAAQIMYQLSMGRRHGGGPAAEPTPAVEEASPSEATSSPSGEDQSQHDQRGEHDRSQDGDALQVT